jgi:hypothetical protein
MSSGPFQCRTEPLTAYIESTGTYEWRAEHVSDYPEREVVPLVEANMKPWVSNRMANDQQASAVGVSTEREGMVNDY